MPDELTYTALTEVKNVATLSYTNQLRDFYWYANSTGRSFNPIVRANTIVSSRLQAMANAGAINLERILPAP
jgi:glutaminase